MSEDKKIKERPEDDRPPTTDDSEKSAADSSISSEENKTVAEENIQHSTLNELNSEENIEVHNHGNVQIDEHTTANGTPKTGDSKESAGGTSFPSAENKVVAEENIQHLTPNIQHNKESMEVHHHGHVHENKKWKEYFFQFLMLFLAVFLGFLAEYQLEHVIENNREKQFMRSMVEDLKKDTLLLRIESDIVIKHYTKLDSLTEIIYEGALHPLHVSKMYELQRGYLSPRTLQLINRTELQLKNSGGMRLIRNRQVADSIINYWSITELVYETRESINVHRGKAKDISFALFNNKYYKHTADFSLDSPLDPLKGPPELINNSSVLLTEFANRISHMSDLLKYNYQLRRLDRQKGNATRLIQLIKKEYHLENE